MWDIDKAKLKTLRLMNNWSREEMARRANISLYSIARLEGNSSRGATVETVGKIADALGKHPGELLKNMKGGV